MARDVVTATLLFAGVAVVALAVSGILLRRDPYDRLHYAGAASSVAVPLIGAALLVDGTQPRAVGELILVLVAVAVGGPLSSHALARSFLVRQRGGWHIDADRAEDRGTGS